MKFNDFRGVKVIAAKCRFCGDAAAYRIDHARMSLCRSCFMKYYERKVYRTIVKYEMLRNAKKVALAVSGGKDSLSLLKALHRLIPENFPGIEIEIIYIDLGIPGYSEKYRKIVESICENFGITLHVYDLRLEENYVVPDFQRTAFKSRICGACGTVKRYLLNKIAYEIGADRLATGHNLDDITEVLFELYLRGSVKEIVRIKPVSWSTRDKLVTKIKPLIEMTEAENLCYALSNELPILGVRCPLAENSRMAKRKKLISMIEREVPGFRHTFYKSHLKRIMPYLVGAIQEPALIECNSCGMPSLSETCSYCKLVSKIRRNRAAQ